MHRQRWLYAFPLLDFLFYFPPLLMPSRIPFGSAPGRRIDDSAESDPAEAAALIDSAEAYHAAKKSRAVLAGLCLR